MISATQKILEVFRSDAKPDYQIVSSLVSVVVKCGDVSDADALLECFLQKPTDFYRRDLLDAVKLFGNEFHTKRLIENCFENGQLKDNISSEILHTLGYIGDESAAELLIQNALYANDHSINREGVLGLLHFDCREFQNEILRAIKETYNKNWFSEFTPALVCKLPEQAEVLENLYKFGSTITSTDCNAGVILGFSLCGKSGEDYFRKVLWNDDWETASDSTGTAFWTFIGTQNLGISLEELYREVKAAENKDELEDKLFIFQQMLKRKVADGFHPLKFIEPIEENFETIYKNLFAWKTPNEADNIISLAQKVKMEKDFYEIEKRLLLKLEQEFYEKFRTKTN